MVTTRLEPIDQIKKHLTDKKNFVLNGGAGSGKTYTLTKVLDFLYEQKSDHKIACITYTNVAAEEIKHRYQDRNVNLRASTIHDFLWDTIKSYQRNIKESIVALVANGDIRNKEEDEITLDYLYPLDIDYKDWKKLSTGAISHNEVLKITNFMFEHHPLLRKILCDKYDFIFIDEYQDTQPSVLDIFLDFLQKEENDLTIGMFGDPMQSIYPTGAGNVEVYIDSGVIQKVEISDNRRCPTKVIDLINQVRNDGIKQEPANNNIEGKITFLYSNNENIDLNEIKENSAFSEFDFNQHEENKELYLTHNLIAKYFGFENLLSTYNANGHKDNLMGTSMDRLASHLYKLNEILYFYQEKRYNDFIKATDFQIKFGIERQELKENIEELTENNELTIENVIELAHDKKLVFKNEKLKNYIEEKQKLYEGVRNIGFREAIQWFAYKNEFSPYSTQHSVKGAEFDNVFVVLDNGRWNQYNFEYLFEDRTDKESVLERTRKIFYVCSSRAKKNLVVFYHKPSDGVLETAKTWFGEENVKPI